jgi:hypothetical protein
MQYKTTGMLRYKIANYEASHYVIFSSFLSLYLFMSTYSQHPILRHLQSAISVMWENEFHVPTKQQVKW